MAILVSTTGILSPVVFDDLGGRALIHPTTDLDMSLEYFIDELKESVDLQNAIDNNWITVRDEFGNLIVNIANYTTPASAFSGGTISGGTYYSGTTELSSLFVNQLTGGTNINTTGSQTFPIINLDDDIELNSVDAIIITGGTFYSGNTPLEQVILDLSESEDTYAVMASYAADLLTVDRNDGNDFSVTLPFSSKADLSGATFTGNISSPIITGGTFYSGNTPLEQVILDLSESEDTYAIVASYAADLLTIDRNDGNDFSVTLPFSSKADLSGATFTGRINAPEIFGTSISGGTFYSGSTDLYDIFATSDTMTGTMTHVVDGINTFTGGSSTQVSVNITGLTVDNLTVTGNTSLGNTQITSLSADTIYSGSTDLSEYLDSLQSQISSNASDKYDKSGGTISGDVVITGDLSVLGSATTLNTEIVQSEDKNIELNYSGNHVTAIGGGITVVSGQTSGAPSELVTNAEGEWISNVGISASNVSGGTLFSGSSELGTLFVNEVNDGTNITIGGTSTHPTVNLDDDIELNSVEAVVVSGGTFYSGNTPLDVIIEQRANANQTFVQNGSNTFTGGTADRPTVNITGGTFDNISVSGDTVLENLTAATIVADNLVVTGNTILNEAQVLSLSAGTIYSGSTPLDVIIEQRANANQTFVQDGFNTFTGGTADRPTVNITGGTFDNISVSGDTVLENLTVATITAGNLTVTGNTILNEAQVLSISAGTIYSGSTPLETVIEQRANANQTFVQDGINTFTGGTADRPTVNITGGTFDNISVSGDTVLENLTAATITAGNLTVTGNTVLENLTAATIVSDNLVVTGNTVLENLTASTIVADNLVVTGNTILNETQVTSLSADTIFSGNTELGDIFLTINNFNSDGTRVQDGINTFTGGTANRPTVNITGGTFDNLTVSGNTFLGNTKITSLSADTIYSGSTDLSTLFGQIDAELSTKYDKTGGTISGSINVLGNAVVQGNVTILGTASTFHTETVQSQDNNIELNYSGNHITAIGGGITVVSGQTSGAPSEFVTDNQGNWVSNVGISASNVSGGTLFSGTSELSTLFVNEVNDGTNITIGGTSTHPTVNLDDDIELNSVDATIITGGTFYSGNTPLELIIEQRANANQTFVQDGINTFTGGTEDRPTVNITGGTFDNLTVSGDTVLENLTAATIVADNLVVTGNTTLNNLDVLNLSAGTIYSGSTPLETVISNAITGADTFVTGATFATDNLALNRNDGGVINVTLPLSNKADLSGSTFTGQVNAPAISGVSISGGTFYSGNTPLELIIEQRANANQTFVQDGVNTFTGGTEDRPTVNITGGTFDNLTVSGDTVLENLTAATIVADNLVVTGNTVLESLTAATIVADNLVVTGNTVLENFTASTAVLDNLTVTGNTILNETQITSLSADTIFSGNTGLGDIFLTINEFNSDGTRVQDGINTFTGGTANRPTVNITGGTFDNLTVTGDTSLGNTQITSLSADTIFSGNTPLETVISNAITGADTFVTGVTFATDNLALSRNDGGTINVALPLSNKADLSGSTFTGNVFAPIITGNTFYSGNTPLDVIIEQRANANQTFVQDGINTFTGGTEDRPTVNITGGTFDNLTVSGDTVLENLTAATITADNLMVTGATELNTLDVLTLSASTIFSGNTPLETVISNAITGADTFVTGATFVTDNLALNRNDGGVVNVALPLSNKADLSGSTFTGNVFAPSITGTSIFSGSTDLNDLLRTASNVGGDEGVFKGVSGANGQNLEFRSISAGTNMNLTSSADEIAINLNDNISTSSLSAISITATTIFIDNKDIGDSSFKSFGEIYIADNTTTDTSVPGGGAKEAIVGAPLADIFAGTNNNFISSAVTVTQDGETNTGPRLTYTGDTSQRFHITTTITGVGVSGNKTFQFYVKKNGTKLDNLTMGTNFTSNPLGVAINGIIEMDTSDYIEVWIFQSGGSDIRIEYLNMTAVQI